MKIILPLIILLLFVLGTIEAFTSPSLLSRIEGIAMYIASYALLFLSSRRGLLPHKMNDFILRITDTSDAD